MSGLLEAWYYDGRTARRHSVTLTLEAGELLAHGESGLLLRAPLAHVRISEPMGRAPRTLTLADGSYFEVEDSARLRQWLRGAGVADAARAYWMQQWRVVLAALCLMLTLGVAGYAWGLPVASQWLAGHLPDSVARSASEATLSLMKEQGMLEPSTLTPARQQALRQQIESTLAPQIATLPGYSLQFHHSALGPNAFALPDGAVVVLDPLVELAENDEEIVAVVAHELGHVAHQHGMRQMIQSTVVGVVVGAMLSDLSSVASTLGAMLLESRYSREFEHEADDYAVHSLRAAGRNPQALASMLARLEKAAGEGEHGGVMSALSSHPETAERIARIQAAAHQQP